MRAVSFLTAIAATLALAAAPIAAAQSVDAKTQQPKATPAAKPAPKAAAGADKAQKVEGATAVRTSPAELKKSGSEKSYDGCSSSKMAASDA